MYRDRRPAAQVDAVPVAQRYLNAGRDLRAVDERAVGRAGIQHRPAAVGHGDQHGAKPGVQTPPKVLTVPGVRRQPEARAAQGARAALVARRQAEARTARRTWAEPGARVGAGMGAAEPRAAATAWPAAGTRTRDRMA